MSSNDNRRFTVDELRKIDAADDLKISPFRSDGITYGTPTWIWNVVVEGQLYVRAYNGRSSRWHQSATQQGSGRIHAAGMVKEVIFGQIEDEGIQTKIDDAYRAKYHGSPYLPPMIDKRAKDATIRINPLS